MDEPVVNLAAPGFIPWAMDLSGNTLIGPDDRLFSREEAIAWVRGEEDDDE